MSDPLNIISLGAGVQSSMPDCAIFADTGDEPTTVYEWLDWLEKQLPFPVHRVSNGHLSERILRIQRSKKSGKDYAKSLVPVFIKKDAGGIGMLGRRCTTDYKIVPILRKVKALAKPRRMETRVLVNQWIGISRDEVIRMKPSRLPWIEHRWPLVDIGMTRQGCLQWMERHGFPKPPRSACTFCPYHSNAEWSRMKAEEPAAFAAAAVFESRYQGISLRDDTSVGLPFLHRSCKPIAEVDFSEKDSQMDLFGNECEGMCGV
jgi:hypothetical protein